MAEIPNWIYKIVPTEPPTPLPVNLALSSLDAQDGFIHLSTATQTPQTADRFFDQQRTLWLLRLDKQVVEGEGGRFVWEDGFVHLYGKGTEGTGRWGGARLGEGTITDVKRCQRSGNQTWSDAMEACVEEGWLVDA